MASGVDTHTHTYFSGMKVISRKQHKHLQLHAHACMSVQAKHTYAYTHTHTHAYITILQSYSKYKNYAQLHLIGSTEFGPELWHPRFAQLLLRA